MVRQMVELVMNYKSYCYCRVAHTRLLEYFWNLILQTIQQNEEKKRHIKLYADNLGCMWLPISWMKCNHMSMVPFSPLSCPYPLHPPMFSLPPIFHETLLSAFQFKWLLCFEKVVTRFAFSCNNVVCWDYVPISKQRNVLESLWERNPFVDLFNCMGNWTM